MRAGVDERRGMDARIRKWREGVAVAAPFFLTRRIAAPPHHGSRKPARPMMGFMQPRGAQGGMTGDPLYEPLGQDTAPRRRTESRWRKLATIAVAGFAVAVVGAIEVVNPDRPRAAVVAVAPIEPPPAQDPAPPGPSPGAPPAAAPASAADLAETGAADVRMENGVKVIRLGPARRADGDAGASHAPTGPGRRATAPSGATPR